MAAKSTASALSETSGPAGRRVSRSRLEQRLSVAVRCVEECVTRVEVSDSTFADAKEVFSTGEIVEMTLLTGFYMMIARFLATLAIDLDTAPVDWSQSDRVTECAHVSRMLARSAA